MTTPQPPVTLQGHCSVIDKETLYTYQSNAFQSLPLKQGASWTKLPMGASVDGGVCVKAVPNGDESQAALYIVGGTSSDSNYPGLQRFTFSNQKWDTLSPVTTVTKNRQWHGAAYLNSTSSILIYGGTQQQSDGQLSSQTFAISTKPPYNVLAFNSQAPPVHSPIVMPWNDSHAVMMGGASTNTQVWTFSSDDGWTKLQTSLTQGIQDNDAATVVSGSDGSKVLEIYDTSVSPNNVTEYVLLNPGGSPASVGTIPGKSRKRKRDASLANWPVYNDTLAPTTIRTGSSIAQDSNGLAVISGGDSQNPISLFNQQENSWLNATQFFGTSEASTQSTGNPSGTPSVVLPSSSTAPSSTSTSAPNPNPPKSNTLTVLGATLGAIFGIAAILLLILLLFRWHKAKRKRSEPGSPKDEKDRLSFIDRGASFMKEAGGSMANLDDSLKPPYTRKAKTNSASSLSSLAIIAGKLNPSQQHGHKRGAGGEGSINSRTELVQKKVHPLAKSEVMEMDRFDEKPDMATMKSRGPVADGTINPMIPVPAPSQQATQQRMYETPAPARKQRSSGWSRYFNGNEATNLAQMHSHDRSTYASATDSRSSAASRSNYTESRHHPNSVDMVAPLELPDTGAQFDGNRISSVVTGSTSVNHSGDDLPQAQRAQIGMSRPESEASEASESVLSSGLRSHLGDEPSSWTPGGLASKDERGGSSIYTNSMRGSALPGGAATVANIGRTRENTIASSVYPISSTGNRDTMDHDFPRPPSNTGNASPANWNRAHPIAQPPPPNNLHPYGTAPKPASTFPEPRYPPAPVYPQAQSGRGTGAPWIYGGGGVGGRGPGYRSPNGAQPGGAGAGGRGLYDGSGWGGSGGNTPATSVHRDSDASDVSHHVHNGMDFLRPATAGTASAGVGGAGRLGPGRDRSSSDTVWPSAAAGSGREHSRVDDMSWLNLNGENGIGGGRR
ncbi:MAG: hypothetical protein Q9157_000158 [Trypethelium eluteriae]